MIKDRLLNKLTLSYEDSHVTVQTYNYVCVIPKTALSKLIPGKNGIGWTNTSMVLLADIIVNFEEEESIHVIRCANQDLDTLWSNLLC